MKNRLRFLLNQDFIATLTNFICRYGLRILLIVLIPLYLGDVEKGYWFTFGSVAALSMVADMGFTTILTQFSAHEFAYFSFRKDKRVVDVTLTGLEKLAGLFKFACRWSLIVTILLSLIITIVGLVLFGSKDDGINWFLPWLIYVGATGMHFFATSCHAFFEGCNCISICQKIKLISSIVNSIFSAVMLLTGFGLYALSIPLFIGELLSLVLLYLNFRHFIIQMLNSKTSNLGEWIKPVTNLLWRYALSWTSGYVIYQIYTPLTFAKYGAVISGKVGYTLTIVSAIVSIAGIWNYISIPKINGFVEKKLWKELDLFFRKNVTLIEFSFFSLIGLFCILLLVPFISDFINKYILLGIPIISLFVGYAFQLATAHIAVYLRAHKEEPLMYSSIVTAIIALLITYITVEYLTYEYVFIGFSLSTIMVFPWVCRILVKKRFELHH